MSEIPVTYEQLIAFAAQELGTQEAARVEAYLETHPAAARTVARYRMVRFLLSREASELPGLRATARAQAIFKRLWDKRSSGNVLLLLALYFLPGRALCWQ